MLFVNISGGYIYCKQCIMTSMKYFFSKVTYIIKPVLRVNLWDKEKVALQDR